MLRRAAGARLAPFGVAVMLAALAVAILAPVLSPYDPLKQDLGNALAPPGRVHLLGTDNVGRDVFSRVIWGTRISLVAGFGSVAIAVVAGVGVGLALLGVNRTLIPLAPPGRRAGLIAAIFIISFLGLSIPALIAGVATTHVGLHRTALAYCAAIAALVAAAAGTLILRRRGPATGQGTS